MIPVPAKYWYPTSPKDVRYITAICGVSLLVVIKNGCLTRYVVPVVVQSASFENVQPCLFSHRVSYLNRPPV